MRLRQKIFAVAVGSLVAMALFIGGMAILSMRRQLRYEFHLRSLALTRTLQHLAETDLRDGKAEGTQHFIESLMGDPDLEEANVYDPKGALLASKVRKEAGRSSWEIDPSARARALTSLSPQIIDINDRSRGHIEMIYQRIWKESDTGLETRALAIIEFSYYRVDRDIRRTAEALAMAAALFTVGAVLISFYLSSKILDPIEKLREAAEAIAAGRFGISLPVESSDEIGILAKTFDRMAKEVRSAHEFLEEKVRERTRELEESQVSLMQAEKMAAVGLLAAGMAHEINNPLGVIRGFAETALEMVPQDSPLNYPLRSIERETLRCHNLVQNLLQFSRKAGPDKRAPIDLNAAVQSAMVLVVPRLTQTRVNLIQELDPGLPPVWGSMIQMEQVLVNLCSNALDAMPEGGTLTVSTATRRRQDTVWVVLTVRDTGQGIPDEIRSRIYDPFFTTKDIGKGTGLGLTLVYQIVKKHDGTIEVESASGKGTVFLVLLPGRRPQPENSNPPAKGAV